MPLNIVSKIRFHYSLLTDYFLAFQSWSIEKRTLARQRLALQFIQGQIATITFERDNTFWTVFPGDVVGRSLFLNGKFEISCLDSLLEWLTENCTFGLNNKAIINIGANIGATCIPLARRTGKRCIACEPVTTTFNLLEQNVISNNLIELISCHQVGISSKSEDVEMAVTGDSGWSEVRVIDSSQGFSSISPVLNYVKARMITLEDLLSLEGLNVQEIGLVWSDTQGFESEVIKSEKKLWLAGIPLWVEIWPEGLEAHGGIEKFISLCNQNFKKMITKEDFDVLNGVKTQEICQLKNLIDRLKSNQSTDILLIP